jgi:hypothetical protein
MGAAALVLCVTTQVLMPIRSAIAAGPSSETGTVNSKVGWQATHVDLQPGDQVSVDYVSGSWTVDYRNFSYVGPDGYSSQEDSRIYQGCKLDSGLPYGVLLGSIGGGPFFVIGSHRTGNADRSGTLLLRIHDGDACLGDNDGGVTVSIAKSSGASGGQCGQGMHWDGHQCQPDYNCITGPGGQCKTNIPGVVALIRPRS